MPPPPYLPTLKFRTYLLLLALGWTLAVGILMAVEIQEERVQTLAIARAEALTNINKDLAYRRWVTNMGGVYVPIQPGVEPNAYLQVPNRDVTTTTGLTLTLINPAYMTRMVIELTQKDYGFSAHLTSLKPLRPQNAPDPWESAALRSFEQGTPEASEVTHMNGAEYLRVMVPFITEVGCLKCHGDQGYQVGDVRGGLSVSIPLGQYAAMEQESRNRSMVNYGILWFLGLGGIYFVSQALQTRVQEREQALRQMSETNERFRALVYSLDDMVYTLDPQQRVTGAYGPWAKRTGRTAADLVGQPVAEALGGAADAHLAAQRRALAGEVVTYEWQTTHAVPQYYQTIISPLHNAQGQIIGAVGVGRDITARKQLEKSLQDQARLMQNIIDSSVDMIFVKDRALRTVLCNISFAQAIGKLPADTYGKTDIENGWDPELVQGNPAKGIRGFQTDDELALQGITVHNPSDPANVGGTVRYFDTIKQPLRDATGTAIVGVLAISRDITERQQIEGALRESENRFRAIFEQAAVGVARIASPTGLFVQVNQKYADIVGYTPAELVGQTFQRLTHADDLPEELANMERLRAGEISAFSMEKRYWRKDGRLVWVNLTVSPLWLPGETPKYHIAVVEDITERKQTEAALHESEARFRNIIEHSPIPYALNDDQQNITYLNAAFIRTFGYTQAEIPTLTDWWPRAYPDPIYRQWVADTWAARLAETKRTGQPFEPLELRIQCLDGTQRVALVSAEALTEAYAGIHLVVLYDITERQQAATALREQTLLLEEAQRVAHLGHYVLTLATGHWTSSPMLDVVFGIGPTYQRTMEGWAALVHPADQPTMLAYFQEQVLGHKQPFDHEYRIVRLADGAVRWVHGLGQLELTPEGQVMRMFGVIQDITERKESEDALRQERDRAQHYLDTVEALIVALDPEGRITLINRKGCQLLGYAEAELLGQLWFTKCLPSPVGLETIYPHFQQIISDLTPNLEYYENPIRTAAGVVRQVAWHNSLLRDAAGNIIGTLSAGEDITERKQAQAQLEQALAEKETLLRELYHRTKNNMQVISALLELQAAELNDPRLEAAFADTQSRIHAMALVHQKLYEAQDLSHINLKDYIQDLLGLLVPSYRRNVRVTLVTALEDVEVLIDTAIPCGLILNELISNALKHAFPHAPTGTLTVQLHRAPAGDIHLRVADDGVGFPPGFDVRRDGHLGLQNVLALGERQLRSQVTFTTQTGVVCELQFRDDLYQARV